MSETTDEMLCIARDTLCGQIEQTKLALRTSQRIIGEALAIDDNQLAEGDSFEKFQAHDEVAGHVSASFQAAYERLVEAGAHIQDSVVSYKQYLAKVQENTDENKSV